MNVLAIIPKREIVFTYSSHIANFSWPEVMRELLSQRKTGTIEMHVSQGKVLVVAWKERVETNP